MKHEVFTTRLRAEEIIKEAISIWGQSFQSDKLEGIENDPVFSLFVTALAYQANELDVEIEDLREDILKEFAQMIVPFGKLNAYPAAVVAEAKMADNVLEKEMDSTLSFTLQGTNYNFIPLLKTNLINCSTSSVVRLDNRRWKVELSSVDPIEDLQGFTFMVKNPHFQDLKIFLNGHVLPLIKPWDYADLPLNDCFSLDNEIYNRSSIFEASSLWFDLFAMQNVRLFCIDKYQTSAFVQKPVLDIELVFEFIGIDDQFFLDKDGLKLNCVVLANVQKSAVTLSPETPLARISMTGKQQFLHLIKPEDMQIMRDEPISVRRTAIDRFSAKRLTDMIMTFMYRYQSDYYAFQQFPLLRDGRFLDLLEVFLKKLTDGLENFSDEQTENLYISFNNKYSMPDSKSLEIKYLMTDGAAVNSSLTSSSYFNTTAYTAIKSLQAIAEPVPGIDVIRGLDSDMSVAKYFMVTNDRVVTPADIKLLCYNVLLTRFGVGEDMIISIKVKNRRNTDRRLSGFETVVFISIKNDIYIQKRIENMISTVELTLQKMIEVRSTNVFPVQVSVKLI